MSQTLELVIKARDEASRALKGVAKEGLGALTAGMAALTVGLIAVKKAYTELVVPVVNYQKAVKDSADAVGMSLEDMSRFIQVGDDMGVSIGSITTALEMATKRGFAPSVGSLAALADRVNAIADPTKRAAELAAIFGRNWAALDPILQVGGQRIRDMAAATEDGLVVTEESVRTTRELQLKVDELQDSLEAAKNEIVVGLIPAFFHGAHWSAEFLIALGLAERKVQETTQEVGFLRNAMDGLGVPPPPWTVTNTVVTRHIDVYGTGGTAVSGTEGNPSGSWQRRTDPDGSVWEYQINHWVRISGPTTDTSGGHGKALGGEVGSGGSYIVGEHGAERFTPGQSGTISPSNDQLTQEIRRMVRTLPTILRDAVQKS